MAAWKHLGYWDSKTYADYRKYVGQEAPKYRGQTVDCADLSVTLLIEFAAERGLPVTLWDGDEVRYVSKAERQTPRTVQGRHTWNLLGGSKPQYTQAWSTKAEYLAAVRLRIGAEALYDKNMVVNPSGPQTGDLMLSLEHAALVFNTCPAGMTHPLAKRVGDPKLDATAIPLFPRNAKGEPDNLAAANDRNQTVYFREAPAAPSKSIHVDYLNHRGYNKEKAELIYYADVKEIRSAGLQFCMYRDRVRDNWTDWKGTGDPPR